MEWDSSDVLIHDPMEEKIWAGNVEVIVADWWMKRKEVLWVDEGLVQCRCELREIQFSE